MCLSEQSEKLAIFVPTYERPDVVADLLLRKLALYHEFNIDLYIYDSNENRETEKVVKSYMAKFNNLYYVKLPHDMHANMKVYRIYQKFGWEKEYDYAWVCGDSIRLSRPLLEKIMPMLLEKYDTIAVSKYEATESREYTDKNVFFVDAAFVAALFGGIILNVDTMLNNVDWDLLIEKYIRQDRVNFSHVSFYFEQIANLNNFKAALVKINKHEMPKNASMFRQGWVNETLITVLHYWPEAINALPYIYENKRRAIRRYGLHTAVLEGQRLVYLRKNGLLDKDIYDEYKDRWVKYSGRLGLFFLFYTIAPIWLLDLQQKFMLALPSRHGAITRLKKFCIDHDKIFIYGAGVTAQRYAELLQKFKVDVEAFVVTGAASLDNSSFLDRLVIDIDELPTEGKIGVVLGMNPQYALEILAEGKLTQDVFSEFIPR